MKSLFYFKKSIQYTAFVVIFVQLMFVACQSDNSQKNNSSLDIVNEEQLIQPNTIDVNYRIPSPLDAFIFIKRENKEFNADNMSSVEYKLNYNTTLSKAINFGVYSSDLAYCSVFGEFQQSLIYFNVLKDFANDLGLYEGFGKIITDRVQSNLNNVDSLIELSAESYAASNSVLTEMGMHDVMSLIVTGCWVESLYVTIKSVNDFDAEQNIVERIVDQRLLLEYLIKLISQNKQNSSLKLDKVLNQLLDLQEEYDCLYQNDEKVLITKKQYVNIANKVQSIRINFIKMI